MKEGGSGDGNAYLISFGVSSVRRDRTMYEILCSETDLTETSATLIDH